MTSRKVTSNSRTASTWPEVSLGLMGLALAAYAWPADARGEWEVKSAVLVASFACLSAWSFFRSMTGWSRGPSPPAIPLIIFSAWTALSVSWSLDSVSGLEFAVVLLWASVLAVSGRARVNPGLLAGVIAGLAVIDAVVGAIQSNNGNITRLTGAFTGATHHAALLACGYAVASVYFVTSRRLAGVVTGGVAVFVLLASASMSGSRTVVIAVVGVLLSLIVARPAGFRRGRAFFLALLSLAALLAPYGILQRVSDQAAGREPLPYGRFDLWEACFRMVRESPVIGIGSGGFPDAFFGVRPLSLARLGADYAHSEPIQVACETGLVGLGFLVWILVSLWRVRPRFRGAEPVRLAGALPLVALASFSLVDFPMRVPVLALLALACFAGWGVKTDGGQHSGNRLPVRLAASAFVMASILMSGWFVAGHVANIRYLNGSSLVIAGDTGRAERAFLSASSIFPCHAESLHALAELNPEGDLSRERLARAGELRPAWMPAVFSSFELAMETGDAEGAQSALARGVHLDPYGLPTMLMKVRWLASVRKYGEAEKQLETAGRIWPNHLDVWMEKARMLESKKDVEGCIKMLVKIGRVYPHNTYVKAWLARLSR